MNKHEAMYNDERIEDYLESKLVDEQLDKPETLDLSIEAETHTEVLRRRAKPADIDVARSKILREIGAKPNATNISTSMRRRAKPADIDVARSKSESDQAYLYVKLLFQGDEADDNVLMKQRFKIEVYCDEMIAADANQARTTDKDVVLSAIDTDELYANNIYTDEQSLPN